MGGLPGQAGRGECQVGANRDLQRSAALSLPRSLGRLRHLWHEGACAYPRHPEAWSFLILSLNRAGVSCVPLDCKTTTHCPLFWPSPLPYT